MDKENIYSQMSAYNFEAPIKVTMIFDSDDDDDIIEQNYEISRKKENTDIKKEIDIDYNKQNDLRNFEYRINQNNLELEHNVAILKGKRKVDKDVNKLTDAVKRKKLVKKNQKENKKNNKNDQGKPHFIGKHQLDKQCEDKLILLSVNIILLMYMYYRVQKQKLEINDEAEKQSAEESFQTVRNYTLEKSCNEFTPFIFMLENDNILQDSFLDFTVKQAAIKKHMKCTHSHVKPFLIDMFQYTKSKQNFQRIYQPQRSKDNPVITSILSRKPIATSDTQMNNNLNNTNQTSPDNRCIFSSGPPGSEITISLPPCQPGHPAFTNLPTDSYQNPPNVQVYNENTFSSINHKTSNRYMPSNFEMHDYNHTAPREHCQINPNDGNTMVQANTWYPYGRQPPDYYLHHHNYHQQTIDTSTINASTIDTSRSSVSTESGYMSPSFSPNYEPTVTGNSVYNGGYTMTPTITDVYSLNNNKSNDASGPCHLCGKYTPEWNSLYQKHNYCSPMCEQLYMMMYGSQTTHHRPA